MASHPPVVVGLTVYREIVREGQPGEISLKGVFSGIRCTSFPARMDSLFCIHAALIDGEGDVTFDLHVAFYGESLQHIRPLRGVIPFRDRHQPVELTLRLSQLILQSAGIYLFVLHVNGEWAAQRGVRVYLEGNAE